MPLKLYIIAGEPSGDTIGYSLIRELKTKNNDIQISGVGGDHMAMTGFQSLFNIAQISVGGIMEIIPHVFKIQRLIAQTVQDIQNKRPDVVITIDSPGFSFRVAKKVRKTMPNIKLIHYVAPSVWAWRPKRAKYIAAIYNHLLTLFKFEPKYFTQENLPTTFVGHPATENYTFAKNLKKSDKIIIMPGSRIQEIKTLLPIFLEAASQYGDNVIIPTLPYLVPLIQRIVGTNIVTETDPNQKKLLFQTAKCAIVASGTATLELALSGCPMVVAYKISPISFRILKHIVKIKFISLVNIIMNKNIVPELIQNNCTSSNICNALTQINYQEQLEAFKEIRKLLTNEEPPSTKATSVILDIIS